MSLAERSNRATRANRPRGRDIAHATAAAPTTPSRAEPRVSVSSVGGERFESEGVAHARANARAPAAPTGFPANRNSRSAGAPDPPSVARANAATPAGPMPFIVASKISRRANASDVSAASANAVAPSHPNAL